MSFSVRILGSSSAVPTSERFPSAHLVNLGERLFLIDCGEGTQIQLRRFKISIGKINHILISHVHGDHVFGLFGLISTFSLLNRTSDLHIYAQPDFKNILDDHLKYFHAQGLPFKIIYRLHDAIKPALIYEDERMTVNAFPLKHRIATSGYIFREKPRLLNVKKEMIDYFKVPVKEILNIKLGADFITQEGKTVENSVLTYPPFKQRAYAYCSDTAYTEKIVQYIGDIDLLYHEATYAKEQAQRAKTTMHSTATEAATIAQKANVGKLIIGHFSARYKDLNQLLEEAREIFPETYLALEGVVFNIEAARTVK